MFQMSEPIVKRANYPLRQRVIAWVGFWIIAWLGIAIAGSVAGLVFGVISSGVWLEPLTVEAVLKNILQMTIAGGGRAASVGSVVIALSAILTCPFRSFSEPSVIAAFAGGTTAVLCMPFLFMLTMPLGIAGCWYSTRFYLRTKLARPILEHGNFVDVH